MMTRDVPQEFNLRGTNGKWVKVDECIFITEFNLLIMKKSTQTVEVISFLENLCGKRKIIFLHGSQ